VDIDPDDGQSPIGTGWQSATISTRFSISRARAPPPPQGEGEREVEYKLVSTRNVSVENERYTRAVLAFSRR